MAARLRVVLGIVIAGLLLGGCGRGPRGGSGKAPAPSGTREQAKSHGPVAIYPPRASGSETTTEIAVRVTYGRLRFPIEDREALSSSLVEAINGKLSRYHVEAKLLESKEEGAGRPVLTLQYSERASDSTVTVDPGSRQLRPTVIRLELSFTSPWLPSGWQRTIEEEKTLGVTTRPLNTDADLRDVTLEDLNESVTRLSFPFGAAYAGGRVAASAQVDQSAMDLAQRGEVVVVSDVNGLHFYQAGGEGRLRGAGMIGGDLNGPVFVNPELVAATTLEDDLILCRFGSGAGGRRLSRLSLRAEPKEEAMYALCAQGDRLYATSRNRLLEIHIADPARPKVLRKTEISAESEAQHCITFAGKDVLCIVDAWSKLLFVRTSGEGLEEVSSVSLPPTPLPRPYSLGVMASERYAYVLWDACSVMAFDLSDLAHPREAFQIFTPGHPCGLAMGAGQLLIADEDGGVYVVDVANPEQPRALGTVEVDGQTDEITCDGALAAVTVQSRRPDAWDLPIMLKCLRLGEAGG